MILRRKRLPDHLEAPTRALDELIPSLERARAALTESVPGTRLPGRPFAESLSEFEDGLREVRARMGGWRASERGRQFLNDLTAMFLPPTPRKVARRAPTQAANLL